MILEVFCNFNDSVILCQADTGTVPFGDTAGSSGTNDKGLLRCAIREARVMTVGHSRPLCWMSGERNSCMLVLLQP